jgi:NADPH:quinone reductase
MTRAVVATAYGGPEVLSVIDEEVGAPGLGEVVIDIRAAGVNPADIKAYSGAFGTDPAMLPKRLGYEAAGVVRILGGDAIGPLGPVSVGDEVIAYRVDGAYADRLVVPATALVPRPANLSWEQAAGLLLVGATATHLVVAAGVGSGDTVLIHGAAGGVGLMAVQLCVARGARVIGTASPKVHELLREFGAEPVAYGEGLAERVRLLAPAGIDAALDTVGSDEAIDVSLELVTDRGRIATIAAFGRAAADGIKLLGGGPGADPGTEIRSVARLDLVRLAAAGELRVLVAETYLLSDVALAHRAILGSHPPGKIVLVP